MLHHPNPPEAWRETEPAKPRSSGVPGRPGPAGKAPRGGKSCSENGEMEVLSMKK